MGVIGTFLCIVLTRVIFVAESLKDAGIVYRSMFDIGALTSMGWSQVWLQFSKFIGHHQKLGLLVVIGLIICWFAPTTKQMSEKFKTDWKHYVFTGALLAVCLARMNQVVQFLYFQF